MSGAPTPGWHGWLLVVPIASAIYDVLAAAALRRWINEPARQSDWPPESLTFFRPLKRGVPRLREKLEMLIRTSRGEDQILFGVDAESEEETICEDVCRSFPDRDVTVVRCEAGRALNPKISKLIQMTSLARHTSWLLSDSEVILSPGFLDGLREEWREESVAALTTAYRFVNPVTLPQRCDAMGVLLGLWPGIALVRQFGHVSFTLGACTIFRRESLEEIGGWEAFGEELAEDQRLGEALVKSRQRIRLSRQIATLDCDPLSWREYWRHQRRVAVTYRAANPAGFAGMVLTFGPVWSLLSLFALFDTWTALAALLTITFRGWRIRRTAQWLEFPVPGILLAFWLANFTEALCWLLSWCTRHVWWAGRQWRVAFRGRLELIETDE